MSAPELPTMSVRVQVIEEPGAVRYRVKETSTHYIEVIPMLVNWRLHTVRKDEGPMAWSERYWCYSGRDERTYVTAVLAAYAWDGADDTEPEGWNKNGQTQEWRP